MQFNELLTHFLKETSTCYSVFHLLHLDYKVKAFDILKINPFFKLIFFYKWHVKLQVVTKNDTLFSIAKLFFIYIYYFF